jgi:hypothetical protein
MRGIAGFPPVILHPFLETFPEKKYRVRILGEMNMTEKMVLVFYITTPVIIPRIC